MTEILNAITKVRQQSIRQSQQAVRQYFDKPNSPYYYISYSDFCKHFDVNAAKTYTEENLNIIDIHLKYRQWVYQEMAPYKWTPIAIMAIFNLIRLRRPPLIIPYIYTSLFDHYMYPFFSWLHKDQKVINMRYEFVTKLSKTKNKERRMKMFKGLERSLKREDGEKKQIQVQNKIQQPSIPYRYLKFGSPTQFVFHSQTEDAQISTVLQTNIFQNYLNFRYPTLSSFTDLYHNLLHLKTKFTQYKADTSNKSTFIDLQQFMKFKDVKQTQQYLLSTQLQKRVRRWIETFVYDRTGKIYMSNFTWDKMFYTYDHVHMTEEPKYNIQQNAADLVLYYSMVLVPTVVLKIFRR